MINTYQIYLISDSTGEMLERIFIAIKAQFKNIDYKINTYSFTRTENQISKILYNAEKDKNPITCWNCRHFKISWDKNFPYECARLGFKSRVLPSIEVLRSDGRDCLAFAQKNLE